MFFFFLFSMPFQSINHRNVENLLFEKKKKQQQPFFLSDADVPAAATTQQQQQQDLYDAKYSIPCSITGLMAAASGGALGFVFGFGSRVVRGASPLAASASASAASAASAAPSSRIAAALADGRASAASFASFGGIYSAAACAVARVRDVDNDPLNGAIAGCVTGAALGWKGGGGVAGAAQSCAMLGGFSYFIDRMQGGQVAQAAAAAVAGSEGGEGDDDDDDGIGRGRERRQRRRRRRLRLLPGQQRQQSSSSTSDEGVETATTTSKSTATCSSSSSSSRRRGGGRGSEPSSSASSASSSSSCCSVGGPLGAALASALPFDSVGDDHPISLLVGPGVKKAASEAVQRLGGVVRGAAEEQVRRARWEW